MADLLTFEKFDTPERRITAAPASTVIAFIDETERRIGHGVAFKFARNFLGDIREQLAGGWRGHLTTRQALMLLRAAHAAGIDTENHKIFPTEKQKGSPDERQLSGNQ